MQSIGHVHELVRYPVKSMAGIPTESALAGFHGLAGDRRFAFRRIGVDGGFPWLTAGRLPQLLLYRPSGAEENSGEPLPTHVRTPSGSELAIGSAELNADVGERFGSGVELMKLKHGIFDEAAISVITTATIAGIGREAGLDDIDRRRFRGNILIDTDGGEPFAEERWIGRTLLFGSSDAGPAVSVTLADERCAMVNFDPDTAVQDPRIMKTIVRLNRNYAGVYGTVVRSGTIRAGDAVHVV